MIRYDLRCARGHAFDAWFRDSAAFDDQKAAGAVSCAVCGGAEVEKALMAPSVAATASERSPPRPAPSPEAAARALAALRRHVEKAAEHVGPRFAAEARRIHLGDAKPRAIWGEATPEEARALIEDDVPVAPLPPAPRRDD